MSTPLTALTPAVQSYLPQYRMARRIGMTPKTFARLVRRGVLPPPVRLNRKLVLYCVAEVEAALKGLQQSAGGTTHVPA